MSSIGYTRKIFEDFENSELRVMSMVCMKNMARSEYGKSQFAIIHSDNIIEKNIVLIDRGTHSETQYDSLDEMLDDGWVID